MAINLAGRSLEELARVVHDCRNCELYRFATQAVFGEGAPHARLMVVGEQPGDEEDKRGRPFVGPAGRVLDEALAAAGVDRGDVYVTNAVKHFKFIERGKRRLHQKPKAAEIRACQPWLDAEIERLRPEAIVALGATAAAALFGSKVSVLRDRGRVLTTARAPAGFVTYHPSAALRAPTPEQRAQVRQAIADDLALAARHLAAASHRGADAR